MDMSFVSELNDMYNNLETFLLNAGNWTVVISCLLVFLEAIFAFLPLCVFINTNIIGAGPVLGMILSWIFTVLGSYSMFWLCRKGFSGLFMRKTKKRGKARKFINNISKLKFTQLVLLISIPFTPSFFVNLGMGISKVAPKKFFYALMIGKVFDVLFWGYVGMKLIECLTNPIAMLKVLGLVLGAYLLGKIVNKRFDIDGKF